MVVGDFFYVFNGTHCVTNLKSVDEISRSFLGVSIRYPLCKGEQKKKTYDKQRSFREGMYNVYGTP